MTQRQIVHPAGEIPECAPGADHRPKHYRDCRRASAGGGDFIECARCDRRTTKRASFNAALADWQRMVAVDAGDNRARARVSAIR